MSYSAINSYSPAPARRTESSLLIGVVAGAFAGAFALAAVVTAPSYLYASSTAVRPAATYVAAVPSISRHSEQQTLAALSASQTADTAAAPELYIQSQVQSSSSNWAFVLCATVAGALNGLFLFKAASKVAAASSTGRREALFTGAAAASLAAGPAFAAYGDSANVFGKAKAVEQVFEVSGDGWSAEMPGKYNPSKEKEVEGIAGRWEDNFDQVNNAYVLVKNSGKNSTSELGSLADVRNSIVTPLLGQQVFSGFSISEGGFAPGRYGSASIVEEKEINKNGKTYYYYELLTRSADGNEGGRHQLYVVAASKGKTFVFRHQVGDKRWIRGLERPTRESVASFTVA